MALPVRRSNQLPVWDPVRELDDLHQRFSSLLESSFGDLAGASVAGWAPPVDVEETDNAIIVEAELPGVSRDDINVELNENQLVIHGDIKERERSGVLHRRARRTGRFDYRVVLPAQVDADQVDASLNEGVLRLQLPKSEAAKPRRIEISSS